MAWKPELDTIDKVIDWYNSNDHCGYTIFGGFKAEDNFIRSEYKGNDKETGIAKLYEALESIKANYENTNSYLIVLSSGTKKATISNTFQLNRPVTALVSGYNPYGYVHQQPSNEILSRLSAIEQKLSAEMEEDDEEEVKEDEGGIAGIFKSPEMQTAIIGLITSYLTPKDGSGKPSAIAGVNDETELWNEARKILTKRGVTGEDIMLLANMSSDNPTQFSMLLKMLRK